MEVDDAMSETEKEWKVPVKDFDRLRHDWNNAKMKIQFSVAQAFKYMDAAVETIIIDAKAIANNNNNKNKEVQDD